MTSVRVREGDWVVVCDGKKALILQNAGDAEFLNLETRAVYQHDDARTREQGSDAPGRAINSIDSRRSSVEQTDWHEEAERRFLVKLVERLDAAVNAGEAKSIIMIAPPRPLGVIRKACSANLRHAIKAEIGKDLVKMPVHEIERHLAG